MHTGRTDPWARAPEAPAAGAVCTLPDGAADDPRPMGTAFVPRSGLLAPRGLRPGEELASAHGTSLRARAAQIGRSSRPLCDGLRQRRLLDLLRPRPRRRTRAGADAARLHVRRRPVRADGQDLCRGRFDVPGGRRVILVRAPRVQRRGLVLRGLGAEPRLHHHDRDLGVLRAALPRRVLSGADPQPRRHHRRPGHDRAAGRPEHPRARRVGQTQPRPRDHRSGDADTARDPRYRARPGPQAAGGPGPPGRGADLDAGDLRALGRDGRLHGHRDRLEHGRGGQRPRPRRAQGRQPRAVRGARRLRGDLGRRALGSARRPPRHRLLTRAQRNLPPRGLRDRARGALRKRPGARDHRASSGCTGRRSRSRATTSACSPPRSCSSRPTPG